MALAHFCPTNFCPFQAGLLDEKAGGEATGILEDTPCGLKPLQFACLFGNPDLAHSLDNSFGTVRLDLELASEDYGFVDISVAIFELKVVASANMDRPLPIHHSHVARELPDVAGS